MDVILIRSVRLGSMECEGRVQEAQNNDNQSNTAYNGMYMASTRKVIEGAYKYFSRSGSSQTMEEV